MNDIRYVLVNIVEVINYQDIQMETKVQNSAFLTHFRKSGSSWLPSQPATVPTILYARHSTDTFW